MGIILKEGVYSWIPMVSEQGRRFKVAGYNPQPTA
jgi:hypothetical protein